MQLWACRSFLFSTVVLCVASTYGFVSLYNNDAYEVMLREIGPAYQTALWFGVFAFAPSFIGSSFGFMLRPLKVPNALRTITAALLFIASSAIVLPILPDPGTGGVLWALAASFGICYGSTYVDTAA